MALAGCQRDLSPTTTTLDQQRELASVQLGQQQAADTPAGKKNVSIQQPESGNTGLLSAIVNVFQKPENKKNVSIHQQKSGKQKLKNVTINQVVGDGNNLSNAGKKSDGPTAQAAPAATVQQATSEKAPAAAAGNDLQQTVPVQEATGWKAVLAKYWSTVLLVIVIGGLCYLGYNRWQANQVKKLLG